LLAQIVEEADVQAEIVRFPVERCRPRRAAGIEMFMLAPITFYLRMAGMLMGPASPAERSKPAAGSDERRDSQTNVHRL
jgi:hypothetical protein